MLRLSTMYLMASAMSGLGGGFAWGRDHYRTDGKMEDIMGRSVFGFIFYSITWPATVPMNISEQINDHN